MTSSWYSEPRCVISSAVAPSITAGVMPVAELGGEQGEHRTDALATGLVQVAARRVGERVGDLQLVREGRLDALETLLDLREKLARARARENALGHAESARQSRARAQRGPESPSQPTVRRSHAHAACAGAERRCRT